MLELIFALLAGILTIAAPCTLPVLPILLGASIGRAGRLRPAMMVACALAAIYLMFEPPFGDTVTLAEIGLAVTPMRLDAQSQVFGLCFALLTAIIALFSSYRRNRIEDVMLKDFIAVNALMEEDDVVDVVRKYELTTVPVLDSQGLLVGITHTPWMHGK